MIRSIPAGSRKPASLALVSMQTFSVNRRPARFKANAILRAFQRENREINGFACIIAVQEDFDSAVRLYTLLNGSAGGQDTKLTKKESDLVDAIIQMHQDEFTIPQLQKKTGLANCIVHKLLHGYASRGATYSGLLEKCPAIAYTDRTVVGDDEFCIGSTRRRTNAYTFDQEIFATWGEVQGSGSKRPAISLEVIPIVLHCCNPSAILLQMQNRLKCPIRFRIPLITLIIHT